MPSYNRILAAIDFSEHAQSVADEAIKLASQMKSELIFVNVINQRDVDAIHSAIDRLSQQYDKISVQRCIDQVHQEREDKMEEMKQNMDLSGLEFRFVTRTGAPFKELLNTIQEEEADLLVMGIKGRSDLTDIMIGSTAQKMFKRCPIPLLTTRKS
jgi:nucleotide-binding universal stress UspA family protein